MPTGTAVTRVTTFRRSAIASATACLALIVLADYLFYRHPVGWTAGGFGLVVLLLLLARSGRAARARSARAIAAGVLGLLVACVVQPGAPAIILIALGLVALALGGRQGFSADAGGWYRRIAGFLGRVWIQVPRDLALDRRRRQRRDLAGPRPWDRRLAGWIIPVVLSLVFVALFGIANPIISGWLDDLTDSIWRGVRDLIETFGLDRPLLWLLTGVLSWGLLRVRARSRRRHGGTGPVARAAPSPWTGPVFLLRCLVLFNALFAVQTVLDVIYLWGGAALPEGMTYAEYARRGAYPLVATALLAATFVLATFCGENGNEATDPRLRWPRRLVYLWIGQNVFLTVSAAWRLWLYVEMYSLTRWRVAAGIWMALVAFGLVTIVWRILARQTNDRLLAVNTLTAIAVLYVCSFVNFDGHIARFNVATCQETGGAGRPIDLDYLVRLGPEALPALRRLESGLEHPDHIRQVQDRGDALAGELRTTLSGWRGWTWRRARLARPALIRGIPAPRDTRTPARRGR